MSLKELVASYLAVDYEQGLLIYDYEGFQDIFNYRRLLSDASFNVVVYERKEEFRLLFETEIKNSQEKWAVIVLDDIYVPYDIRIAFFAREISLSQVFPKLNGQVLQEFGSDLDLIAFAYQNLFLPKSTAEETKEFIQEVVFESVSIRQFIDVRRHALEQRVLAELKPDHLEWMEIAREKAQLEVYAAQTGLKVDFSFLDEFFIQFILESYAQLASVSRGIAPIILPKVLGHIQSEKAALIVMDGMSLFDFQVLARYFDNIDYDLNYTYALIPTTTAISRQSLLSGSYPVQLENPFSLAGEQKGFLAAAKSLGYAPDSVIYARGYNVLPGPFTKLIAIIINDIDDIVHGQKQGRVGMYQDMNLLGQSGKLQSLIRSLHRAGFAVYLTADHGNTECRGVGGMRGRGVEVETKSRRGLVLKDFGQIDERLENETIEYPGYYLDKTYRYFLAKPGVSFDPKDTVVMTHGGISLDEVIVPFVKIRTVE